MYTIVVALTIFKLQVLAQDLWVWGDGIVLHVTPSYHLLSHKHDSAVVWPFVLLESNVCPWIPNGWRIACWAAVRARVGCCWCCCCNSIKMGLLRAAETTITTQWLLVRVYLSSFCSIHLYQSLISVRWKFLRKFAGTASFPAVRLGIVEALESQGKIPQKPTMPSQGERLPDATEQPANHDFSKGERLWCVGTTPFETAPSRRASYGGTRNVLIAHSGSES